MINEPVKHFLARYGISPGKNLNAAKQRYLGNTGSSLLLENNEVWSMLVQSGDHPPQRKYIVSSPPIEHLSPESRTVIKYLIKQKTFKLHPDKNKGRDTSNEMAEFLEGAALFLDVPSDKVLIRIASPFYKSVFEEAISFMDVAIFKLSAIKKELDDRIVGVFDMRESELIITIFASLLVYMIEAFSQYDWGEHYTYCVANVLKVFTNMIRSGSYRQCIYKTVDTLKAAVKALENKLEMPYESSLLSVGQVTKLRLLKGWSSKILKFIETVDVRINTNGSFHSIFRDIFNCSDKMNLTWYKNQSEIRDNCLALVKYVSIVDRIKIETTTCAIMNVKEKKFKGSTRAPRTELTTFVMELDKDEEYCNDDGITIKELTKNVVSITPVLIDGHYVMVPKPILKDILKSRKRFNFELETYDDDDKDKMISWEFIRNNGTVCKTDFQDCKMFKHR